MDGRITTVSRTLSTTSMDSPTPSRIAPMISSLFLAIAIVAGSSMMANAFYKLKASGQTIGVTGSSERVVTSDTVKWTGVIMKSVEATALRDASMQMQQDAGAVVAALKAVGVPETAITLQPMSVSAVCENQGSVAYDKGGTYCGAGRVSGYNVQQQIFVESHDVTVVSKASREVPAKIVNQGIVFSTVSLEYYYSQLDGIKLDLIADATRNAKQRAGRIAESTGSRIGAIEQASQGVFQVTAVNSTDISDYGSFDVTSLQKKVTAVVKATFRME